MKLMRAINDTFTKQVVRRIKVWLGLEASKPNALTFVPPKCSTATNQSTRLSSISCNACGASRTVQNIKHGYHATTKAERRAAKNAAIR